MLRGLILCCVLAGCGSSALKNAGETCTASSECANGLLCDLAKKPAVCADKGSVDAAVPVPDGSDAPLDAAPDAPPIDAAVPDAPPDAAPDAPPDTM